MRMFEAARWAMSSMNNQPWRFLYALRNTAALGEVLRVFDTGQSGLVQERGCADRRGLEDDLRLQRQTRQDPFLRHRRGLVQRRASGHDDGVGRSRHAGIQL